MGPNRNHLLVIGLPAAGKTTFLAALWHISESKEIPGTLVARIIADQAKHVNAIRNEWLQFKPVSRTISGQTVSLRLDDEKGNEIGEVVFPDLSGESFQEQWVDRHCTTGYAQMAKSADSVLLFANADKLREPFTVAEIQRWAQAASIEDEKPPEQGNGETSAAAAAPAPVWSAEIVPTQVQLVGLLQFIQPYVGAKKRLKLAVVVSAWDRVDEACSDRSLAPLKWLSNRMSYLHQFLVSNFEQFEFRVFGVSAQGGDIEKKQDRDRLKEFLDASQRIMIEGPDCAPHDITEPIRWTLGLRDGAESNDTP